MFHQNIQSLGNKMLEVELFLEEEQPDLVCLTELGLSDEHFQTVTLSGYKSVCCSSRHKHRGGGVGFLAKNNLQVTPVDNICKYNIEIECEVTAVDTTTALHLDKTVILGVYRSPNGDTWF